MEGHCGADTRRLEKQPLNHHGKFIGKAEIIEDLEVSNAEGISTEETFAII